MDWRSTSITTAPRTTLGDHVHLRPNIRCCCGTRHGVAVQGMASYAATRPAMPSVRLRIRRHEDEADRHG
ncbi:hypothetical protein N7533_008861 [Penicillium manginii]|uniref:uncharacterized protein n=1 Tax=Penicillium manginii TaxID=203109 RepID=UPI002547A42E|nr:uncharacterized protein N7533_008861 [Penicillium manginii]KAJ5743991.1 hypothetical protein N7533_008861 [Penicillium manginii]